MSRIGNAPAGVYDDTGTKLLGLLGPDGTEAPVTRQYQTVAAMQADFNSGALATYLPGGGLVQAGSLFYIYYSGSLFRIQTNSTQQAEMAAAVLAQYNAAVVAAGDSLTTNQKQALAGPLAALVSSSVWSKLVELWVPLQASTTALAGALIKIKTGNISNGVPNYAMTNVGTHFVVGDYSDAKGLTGDGTTKSLGTNFTPSTSPYIESGNWGWSVFPTSRTQSGQPTAPYAQAADSGGCLGGDGSNTAIQVDIGGTYYSRIDGASTGYFTNTNPHQSTLTWTENQSGVSNFGMAGLTIDNSKTGATDDTGELYLFNWGTQNYFSNASIGGYAVWSPQLTPAEKTILTEFFLQVGTNLGRFANNPGIMWIGDSNGAGYAEVGYTLPWYDRFSTLTSLALGMSESNQCTSGSSMTNADSTATLQWITQPYSRTAWGDSILVIELGTNDWNTNVPVSTYQAQYLQFVQDQIELGFNPQNIILVSPPFATATNNTYSALQQYDAAVSAIASQVGARFVSGLTATYNGGAGYIQPSGSGLHLTVAGHAALSAAILAAITASAINV
jgi:lysophospholipase L1-like esterase